jgi:hypothetical protein
VLFIGRDHRVPNACGQDALPSLEEAVTNEQKKALIKVYLRILLAQKEADKKVAAQGRVN